MLKIQSLKFDSVLITTFSLFNNKGRYFVLWFGILGLSVSATNRLWLNMICSSFESVMKVETWYVGPNQIMSKCTDWQCQVGLPCAARLSAIISMLVKFENVLTYMECSDCCRDVAYLCCLTFVAVCKPSSPLQILRQCLIRECRILLPMPEK